MNFLRLLQVLIYGTRPVPKHDLRKKTPMSDIFREFLQMNFYYIALAAIVFFLIMFVIICFYITGTAVLYTVWRPSFNNGYSM